MKRLFDIAFSLVGLGVFLLPVLVISLLILIKYNHPVIFYQERIGKSKKSFRIFKFQTLVNGVPTKLGILLRKTGLDELPQFLNVLRGEMSIVGPRALTEYDIVRLNWDSEYYSIRWKVRPGITGLAQIYGGQNKKTSWFWDKKYIQSSGICIDLLLLFISFLMNLAGKRKVRRYIWKNRQLS